MTSKHNHWWVSISNGFAGLASIIPLALGVENIVGLISAVFTLLFLGYITARKIEDCEMPMLRVLLIWSGFSAGFIGVIAPMSFVFVHGFHKNIAILIAIGLVFTLIAWGIMQVAKSYEKNT